MFLLKVAVSLIVLVPIAALAQAPRPAEEVPEIAGITLNLQDFPVAGTMPWSCPEGAEQTTLKDGSVTSLDSDGVKHGVEIRWEQSGGLRVAAIQKGSKHGPWVRILPRADGAAEVVASGQYENDEKVGRWINVSQFQTWVKEYGPTMGYEIEYDTQTGFRNAEGPFDRFSDKGVWYRYKGGELDQVCYFEPVPGREQWSVQDRCRPATDTDRPPTEAEIADILENGLPDDSDRQ